MNDWIPSRFRQSGPDPRDETERVLREECKCLGYEPSDEMVKATIQAAEDLAIATETPPVACIYHILRVMVIRKKQKQAALPLEADHE